MSDDRAAVERMLAGYKDLISSFSEGRISAQEFETAYLSLFKADKSQVSGPEFKVLDGLFADIDDYVQDPDLRVKVGGSSDDELRVRARRVFDRLYS